MGRAIVRDPKVFLFDEPLSNLDAKLRVQMRSEIKELHQRLKTTTVYVTHDQIEAMTMADKIVVMRGGHVEQIGTPLELYDNPASIFVAGFIGSPSMNLVPAVAASDGIQIKTGAFIGPVPKALSTGQSVIAGFRPEDITLSDAGVPAKGVLVEPTGAETQLTLHTGDDTIVLTTRDRITVVPGDAVHLSIAEGKLHCFDPETELNLARPL